MPPTWRRGGRVVALKPRAGGGRPPRSPAPLAGFISIWSAGAPAALISPPRLCRRGRPGLPSPSAPSPPPPVTAAAARAFVWPGGALGASRAGNWRPEEANGPARPPLMSGRSRGESQGGGFGGLAELGMTALRIPAAPLPGGGGDRCPGGHPFSPAGLWRAPITLRPCQGLRLPPGRNPCPRRSAKDETHRREGRVPGGPAALPRAWIAQAPPPSGHRHCGRRRLGVRCPGVLVGKPAGSSETYSGGGDGDKNPPRFLN